MVLCIPLTSKFHLTYFLIVYNLNLLQNDYSLVLTSSVFWEIISQTQMEESLSEVMACLLSLMGQLLTYFIDWPFPHGKCNVGPSGLKVHAFSGYL